MVWLYLAGTALRRAPYKRDTIVIVHRTILCHSLETTHGRQSWGERAICPFHARAGRLLLMERTARWREVTTVLESWMP